jgi:non-ribosomal peptide synthetase-like protein
MDVLRIAPGTRTSSKPAPCHLLHQIFERQVARTPDALAVVCVEAGERLTYRELDEKAKRVAWAVQGLGVGRNDVVAIYLPRGVQQYVAMLGILKAGAAYLPIDTEYPAERVRFMLEDAGARCVLTRRDLLSEAVPWSCTPILFDEFPWDESSAVLLGHRTPPLSAPEDLCYVIYTSGTTGRPKGVALSHLNAVTFVRAVESVYGILPTDRILQGFSTTFDASLEEIWMAFSSGATLVVGTAQTMRALDELPRQLRDLKITVFSTVPTLLSVMNHEDLPDLRVLIFGGEAARSDIIEKWARPGRRLMNTYGPTETSVVATLALCHPGRPVTIGTPLPGYTAILLDENGHEVPAGAEGELCIGGHGVSLRGYLNHPELNAQKFFERNGQRFYRTGDLVRQDDQGQLHYCGRIDSQVKIRGYRVELEEVETHIARWPGCDGAIVTARSCEAGGTELLAYIIQRHPTEIDLSGLVSELRRALPAYMIPSQFVAIGPEQVPQLTSGKVNRRALPLPGECRALVRIPSAVQSDLVDDPSLTPLERKLLRIWRTVLKQTPGPEDSFFDLGGNSVLAAEMISLCREDAELGSLGVRDVYRHPTLRGLARCLEEQAQTSGAGIAAAAEASAPGIVPAAEAERSLRVSERQYRLFVLAQGVTLLALSVFGTLVAAGLVAAGMVLYEWLETASTAAQIGFGVISVLVLPVILLVGTFSLGMLAKWCIVGRFREGDHPLWSWGHFRWWVTNLLLGPIRGLAGSFAGSPLAPFFYRALGAKIGKRVYLGSPLAEPDLVTIEDGASLSENVILRTHYLENGALKLRRIEIGQDVFVGCGSIVGGGVRMEKGSKLHHVSCLPHGFVAPAGTEWHGSPAVRVERPTALSRLLRQHEERAQASDFWATWKDGLKVLAWQTLYGYAFGWISAVPLALEAGLLLALEVTTGAVLALDLVVLLPLTLAFSAVRFAGQLAAIIAGKWILTGRAKPGTYPINSREYVKRSFCRGLMATLVSPSGTRGITETIFMPGVLRLLGMRVGRRVEVSDAVGFQPDLVTLRDGAMLADGAFIGMPVVHRGLMTLGSIEIGERAFVGNTAHVPITTPKVADGCLIGVNSVSPDTMEPGTDWLGSPPMRLPARTRSEAPAGVTFDPPRRLYLARGFFNLWKMILPGALVEMVLWVALKVGALAYLALSLGGFLAVLPVIVLGAGLALLALPILAKWTLVGRFRPGEHYLWSPWMWRMEIAYEVEQVVTSYFGPVFAGTPYLNLFYRAMGAQIGRRVYAEPMAFMEADLCTVGDHVSLEGFTQTHLFEDRVMKLGRVVIEEGCSIGANSCVLYNSRMGAGSALGDLSLILKNETFPPNGRYRGMPAERVA